jgi:hypothetical protein
MSKSNFQLTNLEKAALLKKAGLVPSLLEGRKWYLQEMDGVYDSELSPDGVREDRDGKMTNRVYRVSLSGKNFVILDIMREWFNTDETESWTYVFQSAGENLDNDRLAQEKLQKLLGSAEKHLPEAMDILREEYALYVKQ